MIPGCSSMMMMMIGWLVGHSQVVATGSRPAHQYTHNHPHGGTEGGA